MELTFKLPDGTRAGIKPTQKLRELSVKELGMECLTPDKSVSVIFHVPNIQTWDRIRERFGLPAC